MMTRRWGHPTLPVYPSIAVCAAVGVTALFARVPLPGAEFFAPAFILIAAVFDAATAAVLFAMLRAGSRGPAATVLAQLFAGSGVLAIVAMLTLPDVHREFPVLPVGGQTYAWLFLLWHGYVAAGAAIYATVYRHRSRSPLPLSMWIAPSIVNAAIVAALVLLVVGNADELPRIVAGTTFHSPRSVATGLAFMLLCAAALVRVLTLRPASPFSGPLGLTLLALTLDLGLSLLGGARFMLSWYAARMLYSCAALFVLSAAIGQLLTARRRLETVEERAQMQSERLASLWRVSEQNDVASAAGLQAMLDVGTASIRPNKPMVGLLCHIEGEWITIDVVAASGTTSPLTPGMRLPLAGTRTERLLERPEQVGWQDFTGMATTGPFASQAGWRSWIGTIIRTGARTSVLAFAACESICAELYDEQDASYVKVLASFFAHRLHDEVQCERIRYQIEHDPLTGLVNRTQFRLAIHQAMLADQPFAIAICDIDGFRQINRSAGYMIGDELLVEVASELGRIGGDVVARLSADDFGIIVHGAASEADVNARLSRYVDCFATPFHTGDRTGTKMSKLTASFGAARYPCDAQRVEELLRDAEVALESAKRNGGAQVAHYRQEVAQRLARDPTMRSDVIGALEGEQFKLAYQPTFDLASGRIVGAEALIRWRHPERGIVPPAEFIPWAEGAGLIAPITRWVIDRATKDLASIAPLPPNFRCYVNVSASQLSDPTLVDDFRSALARHPGLAPHLGIEVTESAAIADIDQSARTLEDIRALGVRIALDDFGTGYSTMAYLKRLPLDIVKVDRSFIAGVPFDSTDAALFESLLSIAKQLGFKTLAEGIEHAAQAAWVLARGCSYGQGMHLAAPGTLEELTVFLSNLVPPTTCGPVASS